MIFSCSIYISMQPLHKLKEKQENSKNIWIKKQLFPNMCEWVKGSKINTEKHRNHSCMSLGPKIKKVKMHC